MAVVLEVGPGETFLFDTPGGTTTNKLPDALKDIEQGVGIGKPIQQIYCINFGWNGAYFLGARNANGNIIRRHNLPPQLEAWLIDSNLHTCRRDIPSLRIELGPHGSFYADDKDSYRWHNLPDALEEAIQQRITPLGWTATPAWVVLGADGAYIYANNRGGHSYALENYPKLMGLIQGLQQTNINGHTGFALVQWMSMSIYHPGHFIALHRSGNHVAELHFEANQALNSMAATFPKNSLPPIQPQPVMVANRPLSMTSPASPPMTTPTSPPMTAGTTPPVAQTPAFQAPGHAPMASTPMAHPQVVRRPVPQTQTSAPVQHAQAARPMPQHQASTPVPHTQPVRPVSYQHVSSPSVSQVHTAPTVQPTPQIHPPRAAQNNNRQSSNSFSNFLTSAVKTVVAADVHKAQHHPHPYNNNNNNNNNYNSNAQNQDSGGGSVVVISGDSGDSGSMGGDSGTYNGAGVDSGGSSFWSPLQSTATDPIQGGDSGGGDSGGWGGDSGGDSGGWAGDS